MTVLNFIKLVWTLFVEFEIFIERLGKKKKGTSALVVEIFPDS